VVVSFYLTQLTLSTPQENQLHQNLCVYLHQNVFCKNRDIKHAHVNGDNICCIYLFSHAVVDAGLLYYHRTHNALRHEPFDCHHC